MQDSNIVGAAGVPDSIPLDERVTKDMTGLLHEAAERATFHRCEVERWDRIGRAASQALRELQSATPVQQMTPESFSHDESAKVAF